jgi:hyperosmotically inducible periplasmic protein
MIGRFIRFLFVMAILLGAVAYFTGYWQPSWLPSSPTSASTRSGSGGVDVEEAKRRARAAGEVIGDTAKQVAKQLDETFSDGALTTKIKSKMALDDLVNARDINVDTKDHVVTLTGTVASARERERAVALAKETQGVKRVEDKLTQSGS